VIPGINENLATQICGLLFAKQNRSFSMIGLLKSGSRRLAIFSAARSVVNLSKESVSYGSSVRRSAFITRQLAATDRGS